MDTLMEQLIEKIEYEFDEYKDELLAKNSGIIFDSSYETTVKEEIVNYIMCGDNDGYVRMSREFMKRVLSKKNSLEYLYYEYLNQDNVNIMSSISQLFKILNE